MAVMEICPETTGLVCSLAVINSSVPHRKELATLPFLLVPEHFSLKDLASRNLLEHGKI